MHIRHYHLFAVFGFGTLLSLPVAAQDIELLTEAPVTLSVTFTTATTTTTGTTGNETKKTATTTTRILQADIIKELFTSGGIMPLGAPTLGWSLKAVRNAPADLAFVTADFSIYAVNPTYPSSPGTRVLVPSSKFNAIAYSSVQKYTEKYQGQYILSSTGTVSNHVGYDYQPTFISTSTPTSATVGTDKVTTQVSVSYALDSMHSEGLSTISFALSDVADILYYAIKSLNVTATGEFTATSTKTTSTSTVPLSNLNATPVVQSTSDTPVPASGLVSIGITVGAPILVDASLYPDVPVYPYQP